MASKVYVETSRFSFYYDERESPAIVARRAWTREWWDTHRHRYNNITSLEVMGELAAGQKPHRAKAHAMAGTLPAVSFAPEDEVIVEVYIRHRLMPQDPLADAVHLALASRHNCDYLRTWNCQHLANPQKFPHIRAINAMLGLHMPTLVTPLELLGLKPE